MYTLECCEFSKDAGEQHGKVPRGAKVINAGLDPRGRLCVWAWVDHEVAEQETLRIFVVETGGKLPDEACTYIGSFAVGECMRHVFL